jgi:hypothetical protein
MSAHLSRLRLFQRHLRSLVWVWVWVWDWVHWHTSPRTRSPSSRHPSFTHYPFPPRSLVYGGQTSLYKPRLVVPQSTCPPLSSSPKAHSFVFGTAVINNNPGVLGSIPKREEQQEQGKTRPRSPPCVKVPGSSQVLPSREQLYNRYCSNKHIPMGSIPKRETTPVFTSA